MSKPDALTIKVDETHSVSACHRSNSLRRLDDAEVGVLQLLEDGPCLLGRQHLGVAGGAALGPENDVSGELISYPAIFGVALEGPQQVRPIGTYLDVEVVNTK